MTFPAQMMMVLMQYCLTKTFAADNLIKGKNMNITVNNCYDEFSASDINYLLCSFKLL